MKRGYLLIAIVVAAALIISVRLHNTPYLGTCHAMAEEALQVCETDRLSALQSDRLYLR